MGLTHTSRQSDRIYPAKNLWRVIPELYRQDFDHIVKTGDDLDRWVKFREKVWDPVFDRIKAMEEKGTGLGDLQAIDHILFCEWLSLFDDPMIRMTGSLLNKPVVEDLFWRKGTQDLVEDFFIKTYNIAPQISLNAHPGYAGVLLPSLLNRIKTGYPSPRTIKRDFLRLFDHLYSVDADVEIKKDRIVFSVKLNLNDTPVSHRDFVDAGLELLKIIENRGAYT